MNNNLKRFVPLLILITAAAVVLLTGLWLNKNVINPAGTVSINLNLPDLKDTKAFIDNKDFKLSGLTGSYGISAKNHQLKVTRTGYKPSEVTFDVQKNKTVVLNVVMQPQVPQDTPVATAQIQSSFQSAFGAYDIQSVQYFYNNTWAFVIVGNGDSDPGMFVSSYSPSSGKWSIVLGPGTIFSKYDIYKLPDGVQKYMKDNGYVTGEQPQ